MDHANQAPRVQTGHTPGINGSYIDTMVKKTFKISSPETMRLTAYIFSI